jgi:hypothetical protein
MITITFAVSITNNHKYVISQCEAILSTIGENHGTRKLQLFLLRNKSHFRDFTGIPLTQSSESHIVAASVLYSDIRHDGQEWHLTGKGVIYRENYLV